MIEAVPRPRPPHLHRERTRHGATVWYVRTGEGGKGTRIRIKAEYGTPEFAEAYRAAIAGEIPKSGANYAGNYAKAMQGTLAWLLERYRDSGDWAKLSKATRRQRDNIFSHVIKSAGGDPIGAVTRKAVLAAMDRRRATPFQARNFLQAMRGLFKWAVNAELVANDPTDRIDATRPKTAGFKVWTEDDIARFEARWPIGTRERLALAIFLYSGARRGDAARLGRQHVRDGVLSFRTEKNNAQVTIPLLPDLAEIIAATKTGDLAFIAGADGRPLTKESLGNWFREACNAAGVNGSAHGLRKAGATRAANNGATVAQLEAIFGWSGGGMAALYTRQADRIKLAREAMGKMTNGRASKPAPDKKVRVENE